MDLEQAGGGALVPVATSLAEIHEALDEQARAYAARSITASTRRAYETDWSLFVDWCARQHFQPLPATPETVYRYIADLAAGTTGGQPMKTSTILRRVSSISVIHKSAGYNSPTADRAVQTVLKGVKRRPGREHRPVAKTAATTAIVRRIVAGIGTETPVDIRDRAIILIGFPSALRRSELTALDIPDLVDSGGELLVYIASSKTDQEGEGLWLGIPSGSRAETDPVRAWNAWRELAAAAGDPDGPAFRPVGRSGKVLPRRLSDQSVALIVKRRALAAGLSADEFAAHSLRSGFATSAAEAGAEEREIMRQGRWRSVQMARRYVQRGKALDKNNPARKLGL